MPRGPIGFVRRQISVDHSLRLDEIVVTYMKTRQNGLQNWLPKLTNTRPNCKPSTTKMFDAA